MKYIHCLWIHDLPDDPVLIVSEFDHNGFEKRKVEIWRSGRIGLADGKNSSKDTMLSINALVSMDQYNDDEQFFAVEITKEEFENHWALANRDQYQ